MISRVAEGCFWLARYLERVETLARLLDVHHALQIDAGLRADERWSVLLDFTGQEEDFCARVGRDSIEDGEAVQHYLSWDEGHPSSLYSALRAARENARSVREIMSLEAWQAINDLWLWMQGRDSKRLYERNRSAFFERLMSSTLLFHGVSHATMIHDEPFTFMKLARSVERAAQTARILRTHAAYADTEEEAPMKAARCLAVLRCCCAYDPFFRSEAHVLDGNTVTHFLVFDPTLPRSVLFNLDEARRLLRVLRRYDPVGLPRRSSNALERLRGELLQMDLSDIERLGLQATLSWLIRSTDRLCDAIHDDYLDPPMAWLRHCVSVLERLEESRESSDLAA